MMRKGIATMLVVPALLLAGCDSGSTAEARSQVNPPTTAALPETGATTTSDSPAPTTEMGADVNGGSITGAAGEAIIQEVFAAAEELTGLNRVEMTLMRANAVRWNDGSLGCPEPGVNYTQALTDGYWIQLDLPDSTTLDFRGSNDGVATLCESST